MVSLDLSLWTKCDSDIYITANYLGKTEIKLSALGMTKISFFLFFSESHFKLLFCSWAKGRIEFNVDTILVWPVQLTLKNPCKYILKYHV